MIYQRDIATICFISFSWNFSSFDKQETVEEGFHQQGETDTGVREQEGVELETMEVEGDMVIMITVTGVSSETGIATGG